MAQLDEEVEKWAKEIMALSPTVIATVKASFRYMLDETMKKDMHQILSEVRPNFYETSEQLEGTTAFLEKRLPDFTRFRFGR
jgi:2-ketocyclohexanecarboxyl-CoA hydrolase